MDSFAAVLFPRCQEFFYCFSALKQYQIEQANAVRRPCADVANEFIGLISLINSYLAFYFFRISVTKFLFSPHCSKEKVNKCIFVEVENSGFFFILYLHISDNTPWVDSFAT